VAACALALAVGMIGCEVQNREGRSASQAQSPKDTVATDGVVQSKEIAKKDNPAVSKQANMLPNIRVILDGMQGHNYALPDCLAFFWERLDHDKKTELNFWDFAAITGDSVSPVYNRKPSTRCEYCVSGYLAGKEYMAQVFDAMGYEHVYVTAEQINADKETCLRKVVEYIDKGLPVLVVTNHTKIPGWESDVGTHGLIVGYDDAGKTLEFLVRGDKPMKYDTSGVVKMDWVFIGKKSREVTKEELYLNAIRKLAYWLTLPERDGMCFGAAALRAWADDIENGRYEDETVDLWDNYSVYVVNMATSGGVPTFLLWLLAEMDEQYAGYRDVAQTIQNLLPCEPPRGGKTVDWIRLEELGGGIEKPVTRDVLRDEDKRANIAAVLRDRADRLDKVVEILKGL
jgi:hypothetical protein